MNKVKVLGIQVGLDGTKEENLARAMAIIDAGMREHPETDIICLPEVYYAMPTSKNKDEIGETPDGPFFKAFAQCAKRYNVNIITGTAPMVKDGKLYNTCFCINRKGEKIGEYSKTHLFDAFAIKESDVLTAGDQLGIVDFDFGRVGIAVCYELRFPEYLAAISRKGICALFVPAAFYRPREDQWDILVKAAALQQHQYVVAVNQFGRKFFGRSGIVDPLGAVNVMASDGEGFFSGELDLELVQKVKAENPLEGNRRPELYV